MKTIHLTDEELDAIKCALRLAISTPGDFTLRADMLAALKKVDPEEGES